MIDVVDVSREFRIYEKAGAGFFNAVKSAFVRKYTLKHAVEHVSFQVGAGEIVGYVGPNGAGKSTTIKMLTGILAPTSGCIIVDGLMPHKQRIENAKKIGVVFGQRSQLYWDLPVRDSFMLHKRLYEINDSLFERNVQRFVDVLQMSSFLDQPVRQLSLGQKMRANIAIALLHDPKLVYLDEPTIGLDILAKERIREFIREKNRTDGTTFILTTHDMDDIESVCDRLMMINHGKLLYDGTLSAFKDTYGDSYSLVVSVEGTEPVRHPAFDGVAQLANGSYQVSCNKSKLPVADAVSYITQTYVVREIKIVESDVESILKKLYENDVD